MPSPLPKGDPAPASGELPQDALQAMAGAPLGVYVHVPFCRVRCGYCDFNTYTPGELGDPASVPSYLHAVRAEFDLAARVLGASAPAVSTVFFGGGTPTMLDPGALVEVLELIGERWGLAPGAEVTTEANPDSVGLASLRTLAEGGFTRVSFGMQSAVPHVLATLDRTHDPANVGRAMSAARQAGLATSLDLIYGTPGESVANWRSSLDAAVALQPDHISAYALVVEEGTRMAGQVRRGELAAPTQDDEADKYELADQVLGTAGYRWYEVSNWARTPQHRCRHNLGYWSGASWWGLGPGAHSHIGGVRWWNLKHPRAYASRAAGSRSPAAARELLDAEQRYEEQVLLGVRLADGLPVGAVRRHGRGALPDLVRDGLVEGGSLAGAGTAEPAAGRIVLTLRGRLLADTVVRRLLGF